MSMPAFPSISPAITRDDAINQIISSIAMEELGLSHIINAEGEKLQYVVGTLPGISGPPATISDVLAVNNSVRNVLGSAAQAQLFLNSKLETVLNSSVMGGPAGATGATGPTGPTGPAAILAYGGLYNDSTQFITIPAVGTQGVALPEGMASTNVTLGLNSITIDIAGDYRVEYFIQLQSTGGNFDVTAGVEINGGFSQAALINNIILTTVYETITLSGIVALAAGDVLTLALSSLAGGDVLFGPGTSANLSVMRLGA